MDKFEHLAKTVRTRLTTLGLRPPSIGLITSILNCVHDASLITEEGRFIQGSVTYQDPDHVHDSAPATRRADYPSFTKLTQQRAFTPKSFAKLARAVDKWSGSIAIWSPRKTDLLAWGIVDQLVGTNILLNREGESGFGNRGLFMVSIDRPGDFTVYHDNIFLAALRSRNVVLHETDALNSQHLLSKIIPHWMQCAAGIARALPDQIKIDRIESSLLDSWSNTIARLCIGLRRLQTGGSFLITPDPKFSILGAPDNFRYDRLRDSVALQVLDRLYLRTLDPIPNAESMSDSKYRKIGLAQSDLEDRNAEVGGCIKLVTSLAALDGAVLLTPDLSVAGFGVKIGSDCEADFVFDGDNFERHGMKGKKRVDLTGFGTRHLSVLRYCKADRGAIGVIVSQDGFVRIAATVKTRLLLWDGVQLLNQTNYGPELARRWAKTERDRIRSYSGRTQQLGFTPMPKTYANLLGGELLSLAQGASLNQPVVVSWPSSNK